MCMLALSWAVRSFTLDARLSNRAASGEKSQTRGEDYASRI